MNFRAFRLGPVAFAALLLACSMAADGAESFSVKQYRWPPVLSYLSPGDDGAAAQPATDLPPEDASEAVMIDFMRRSNGFVCFVLEEAGAVLPEGTLAVLDPDSGTMAIRVTDSIHEQIDYYMNDLQRDLPRNIPWSLEVVEAPGSEVRKMLGETHRVRNHEGFQAQLLKKGRSISFMQGETKPGTRTVSESGSRVASLPKTDANGKSEQSPDSSTLLGGQRLELDPVVSRSGIIDLNLSLEQTLTDSGGSSGHPLTQLTVTSIAMENGHTRLLGVSKPRLFRKVKETDLMHATFLRVKAVPVMPDENPRVGKLLEQLGEKVVPIPKGIPKLPQDQPPAGMEIKRFKVSPDFLHIGGPDSTPADPFAPADPSAPAGDRRPSLPKTAEEVLKEQGVPFPAGSWARFVRLTSHLIVCNTLENLGLVEAYFETSGPDLPKMMEFTIHVVQSDGAQIREMEHRCFGKADHSGVMKELMGAASDGKTSFVHSLRVEAKAGTRAKISNAFLEPCRPPSPDPKDTIAPGKAAKVGIELEVDPVVGADGRTIDLNFSLYHDFAPPTQAQSVSAASATEFHRMTTTTSITMDDGSTRLISVWKPTGSPEFEGDILQAAFLTAHVVTIGPE